MNTENWIEEELARLRAGNLERKLHTYPQAGGKIRVGNRLFLNLSSNDYLGLAGSSVVKKGAQKALDEWGGGATASRLVAGSLTCHDMLEKRLASYKQYPAAIVFGSGYMTNIGAIPAVVGRNDVVVADRLIHASIIDGVMLSHAILHRFQHNDVTQLNEILKKRTCRGRCLVMTESVFSMDGDIAPLRDIVSVASKYGAMLMVDEAHATGVFGPKGAGLVRKWKLEKYVNLCMGTLSKAFGSYGGVITCSESIKKLLINRARSFIFSTAMPPPVVGASLGALDYIKTHPNLGIRLLHNTALFRKKLQAAGLNTGSSASQIVPVIVGENQSALSLARRLGERRVLAVAIRPPTVPQGSARLRFSVTLAHTIRDLNRAAEIIIKEAENEGLL